jgi:hypothetical protein
MTTVFCRCPVRVLRVAPLAALALAACSHVGTVRMRAAFDLDCHPGSLVIENDDGVYVAAGCGAKAAYTCRDVEFSTICRAAGPATESLGPVRLSKKWAVEARAAEDLGCPEEQVAVVSLAGEAFGATGCGRRLSYTCVHFPLTWACRPEHPVAPTSAASAPRSW